MCKEYGVSICASESIFEEQKKAFCFRELDVIKVKGRNEAVKIYELI